jgi:hypothetical protein
MQYTVTGYLHALERSVVTAERGIADYRTAPADSDHFRLFGATTQS